MTFEIIAIAIIIVCLLIAGWWALEAANEDWNDLHR